MKFFKILTIASFALASAAANADFISGLDDGCPATGCVLENNTDPNGNWVDPAGTDLDGAMWINPSSEWFETSDGAWRVWEEDLDKNGMDNVITSLFVSFDDELQIKSSGNLIWTSVGSGISQPWTQVVDIIALVGGPINIAGNRRINFYVTNSGGGPTGVIWKGHTAVPEPGTLALLGLGLVGLAARRRKTI